jgi:hypothetical protein
LLDRVLLTTERGNRALIPRACQPRSHLLHMRLVQNLLHGQQLDNYAGALVEGGAFGFGLLGVWIGSILSQQKQLTTMPVAVAARSP